MLLFKNNNQSNLNFEFNNAAEITSNRNGEGKKEEFNLYALIPTLGTIEVGNLELGLIGALSTAKNISNLKTEGESGNFILDVENKDEDFIRKNYISLAISNAIEADISLFSISS